MPTEFSPNRKPETIWRLVESQCRQLSDAVSSARVPFLLSLLWGFIWGWSLYINDMGHLKTIAKLQQQISQDLNKAPPTEISLKYCNQALSSTFQVPTDLTSRIKECQQKLDDSRKNISSMIREQTMISFPGGFPKTNVSDLGILGIAGLCLIHSWLFFAMRRESHAIATFVDFDHHSALIGRWIPKSFDLKGQLSYMSSEHLVYAYHSVAQRFIFIFSHRSRPLVVFSALLLLLPTFVASWNLYTDLRDLLMEDAKFGIPFPKQWWGKAIAQTILLMTDIFIALVTMRYGFRTGAILNGWYLASRDVWMQEWDEDTPSDHSTVHIEVEQQRATPSNTG